MKNQPLIQYVFWDGSETVTNPKGKVVAVKDPDTKYLPLELRLGRYVQGSIPELYSRDFSKIPKINEYLLSSIRLGFGRRISSSPIKEINREFYLPSEFSTN
jgi:hypothetical protein